jgi:23S rRNA U2552 (ribose-2'-O)-methylase RlmE/FtsJ
MLYFLLHQIKFNLNSSNIKVKFEKYNDDNTQPYISKSLSKYLNNTKQDISNYLSNWDIMKRYTNPYEFIHTNLPNFSFSISKIKPISRAFFKITELYNTFNILDINKPITTYHLAEGPGGFIEATAYLRKNKLDKYYGITLIDKTNTNIPGWRKSENFLTNNPNVIIEKGFTGDGNIYNEENFLDCVNKHKNSIDIITGDGGFDFSNNFNNQECAAFRLIYTQMVYAISMQKYGGTFILKIYDIFLKSTLEILYILSTFYTNIYITKPNTSRYANSEKYLVCTDFRYSNTNYIAQKFHDTLKVLNNIDFTKYQIRSVINIPIQLYFINQIEEINAILGQQQIENIVTTIKLINLNEKKGEKIDNMKNQNIQKCITWCMQNKIPYNKNIQPTNIFMRRC